MADAGPGSGAWQTTKWVAWEILTTLGLLLLVAYGWAMSQVPVLLLLFAPWFGMAAILALLSFVTGGGGAYEFEPAGTVFIAGCAVVLYFIRREYRVTYGILEVAFGLAVTHLTLTHGEEGQLVWERLVALVASVYLVVRGLDNIEKGWTGTASQPKKQPSPSGDPSDG